MCVGTVLLGLGCTPADEDDRKERQPVRIPPVHEPKLGRANDNEPFELPRPVFGTPARQPANLVRSGIPPIPTAPSEADAPRARPLAIAALRSPSLAPSHALPARLRDDLLTSVSEAPMMPIVGPAPVNPPVSPPATPPATPVPITAKPAPAILELPDARTGPAAFATEQGPQDSIAEIRTAPAIDPETEFGTETAPETATEAAPHTANVSPAPIAGSPEQPELTQDDVLNATETLVPARIDAGAAPGIRQSDSAVLNDARRRSIPAPKEDVQEASVERPPERRAANRTEITAEAGVVSAPPALPETAPETQTVPTLASVVPPRRVPVPMVSRQLPDMDRARMVAANDADGPADTMADMMADTMADKVADEIVGGVADKVGDDTANNFSNNAATQAPARIADNGGKTIAKTGSPLRQTVSLPAIYAGTSPVPKNPSVIPPNRTRTTLGLGTDLPQPAAQETPQSPLSGTGAGNLAQERSSGFTLSDQPPVLDYQDELILEIQVKGIDASDTILAYGTRQGVYLPLGTLARILDLAITVGDDGNYANGWVLDPDRTITIDVRRGSIDLAGREQKLPVGAAVAFDGDLFLLASQIADFLPLTVETDLRAQTVTLTTLEPFPFEERMRREADRARLANRSGVQQDKIFARQDTPYLLASLPVVDVDLRALSDSSFGSRAELDLQFAGDLGFLTAESFIGADTANGLTTSLIKVGRLDPDAQLLGPLAATAFALGDVATISMPLGLRSVAGRGIALTNAPSETVSVFERIDLRGILPDGFEVELYRNDILVGSTRDAVNGQYEFLQTPVDFGLNVFRLVFFGPQGQRSEQVRRISVGDGRLPTGKLVYRMGAVQKDENLLGVRPPDFIRPRDFGTWRASGEVAYGVSPAITAIVSGAVFEADERQRWISTAGIRTGFGGFALKADLAAGDGGAFALSGGIGGRIGGSAVTLSHIEYSGDFIDETRGGGGEFLTRATELDFNTTLEIGNPVSGLIVPITARARRVETAQGQTIFDATLRASSRFSGLLASNTFDYTQTRFDRLGTQSRLFGNFDLTTLGRSRTRGRLSLGYQILPQPDIVSAGLELDHALDEDTAIRGSVGYLFDTGSVQLGLSAVRDFNRFSLALDGAYAVDRKEHSIGLRLGFSFGRDPVGGRFFLARPGLSGSGGASVRAFRDLDGDGMFGPGDTPLPDISIVAFNNAVPTDARGIARLGNLSPGRGVSLQIDESSLPDIDLAPATEGIEIVPRPGRIHGADFAIVALSEVEGSLRFTQDGTTKGVSGVRLKLRDTSGKDVKFAKTEIDGYFFFERVKPGTYAVALDETQAGRLDLCAAQDYTITVGYEADLVRQDIDIGICSEIAQ